jgi:hypothetical protein
MDSGPWSELNGKPLHTAVWQLTQTTSGPSRTLLQGVLCYSVRCASACTWRGLVLRVARLVHHVPYDEQELRCSRKFGGAAAACHAARCLHHEQPHCLDPSVLSSFHVSAFRAELYTNLTCKDGRLFHVHVAIEHILARQDLQTAVVICYTSTPATHSQFDITRLPVMRTSTYDWLRSTTWALHASAAACLQPAAPSLQLLRGSDEVPCG